MNSPGHLSLDPGPGHRKAAAAAVLAFLGLIAAGSWLLSGCGRIPSPARQTSTPTPTSTPSFTPSPSATSTPTATPSPTPEMIETFSIGESVEGRPLVVHRIGWGERVLVVAGAIHGSETGTALLANLLTRRFTDSASSLPAGAAVYFLPEINPDGVANGSRLNADHVDLNRNWGTSDWRSDPAGPDGPALPLGGGSAPFSEPETAALEIWLLGLRDQASGGVTALFYHSAYPGGSVQPGYTLSGDVLVSEPQSAELAGRLADQLGYTYLAKFPTYNVTGNEIGWCAENGLTCIEIELPTASDPTEAEIELHFTTLWQLIVGR